MTKELYDRLSSYKNAKLNIKELDLKIEEIETRLLPSGIEYDKECVQTSPRDPMIELIEKAAVLREQRDDLAKSAAVSMEDVCNLIDRLDDATSRAMLKYKWIECITWKDISKRVYLSEQGCFKKNRIALKKLEEYV